MVIRRVLVKRLSSNWVIWSTNQRTHYKLSIILFKISRHVFRWLVLIKREIQSHYTNPMEKTSDICRTIMKLCKCSQRNPRTVTFITREKCALNYKNNCITNTVQINWIAWAWGRLRFGGAAGSALASVAWCETLPSPHTQASTCTGWWWCSYSCGWVYTFPL